MASGISIQDVLQNSPVEPELTQASIVTINDGVIGKTTVSDILASPSKVFTFGSAKICGNVISGYGVNGIPNSDTQAAIDYAISTLGWPSWAILWQYLGETVSLSGCIAAAAVSLQPQTNAVTLAGVSFGSFNPPAASVRPAVTYPALLGGNATAGTFAMPPITLRPQVAAGVLAGIQQGKIVAPAAAVRPVVAPPTISGVAAGSLVIPSITLQPWVAAGTLTGLTGSTTITLDFDNTTNYLQDSRGITWSEHSYGGGQVKGDTSGLSGTACMVVSPFGDGSGSGVSTTIDLTAATEITVWMRSSDYGYAHVIANGIDLLASASVGKTWTQFAAVLTSDLKVVGAVVEIIYDADYSGTYGYIDSIVIS